MKRSRFTDQQIAFALRQADDGERFLHDGRHSAFSWFFISQKKRRADVTVP